ncbi:peptide ABC transporter substrate-binding protein, partial [Candidatus Saccharibacteria bacterium]|nr:peptide ABC transporter substrate-binding protein [Candidatus Saccharibacteria bacterium]
TSRLIFNGLLRYDTEGKLVPDLAKSWSVNDDKKTYVVNLRDDVTWHDGSAFTANDVVYTIKTIQNPETRSTKLAGWRSVTVAAPSKYQVSFTLPATLASFPDALTQPIVPEHILNEQQPSVLRNSSFNTNPVGTGPFISQVLRATGDNQQLELKKNSDYYRGAPQLDRFVLRTFSDSDEMREALSERDITAAVGLPASIAEDLALDTSIRVSNVPLYSGVYAFFKTNSDFLTDTKVRSALVQSYDRQAILKLFDAQYAPLKTPLLPTQLGFNSGFNQVTDIAAANKLLDEAGWVMQGDGVRAKDGLPLELRLVTVDTSDQAKLATDLEKQWREIGVKINLQLLSQTQFEQSALGAHDYDILLYGISIDHDPDVYAYWHSSQAAPGKSNFSEWKSARADASLDVARTRLEPVLRTARYQTFQDEWRKEAPAIALYQLQTTYAAHQNAQGYVPVAATNAADRLTNVEDWTINTKSVLKTP